MKVYQREAAYEEFRTCPQTDLLVPLRYLPVSDESQSVFMMECKRDGESAEQYCFLTGYTKAGQPAMVQILPEE